MRRFAVRALLVLVGAMACGSALLWARSRQGVTEFRYGWSGVDGRRQEVAGSVGSGRFFARYDYADTGLPLFEFKEGWRWRDAPPSRGVPPWDYRFRRNPPWRTEFLGFSYSWAGLPGKAHWTVIVPCYAATAGLFAVPALYVVGRQIRRGRRKRRLRAGRCVTCGYDLRGSTSGPCPECGTDNRAAAPPAAP